jgi:hypothetical protein
VGQALSSLTTDAGVLNLRFGEISAAQQAGGA